MLDGLEYIRFVLLQNGNLKWSNKKRLVKIGKEFLPVNMLFEIERPNIFKLKCWVFSIIVFILKKTYAL